MILYIPFWIYSNAVSGTDTIRLIHFTFHSGYIPIKTVLAQKLNQINFTFHSGYIPIREDDTNSDWITGFTFHSGYIPIGT